jgi:hypothetical protein
MVNKKTLKRYKRSKRNKISKRTRKGGFLGRFFKKKDELNPYTGTKNDILEPLYKTQCKKHFGFIKNKTAKCKNIEKAIKMNIEKASTTAATKEINNKEYNTPELKDMGYKELENFYKEKENNKPGPEGEAISDEEYERNRDFWTNPIAGKVWTNPETGQKYSDDEAYEQEENYIKHQEENYIKQQEEEEEEIRKQQEKYRNYDLRPEIPLTSRVRGGKRRRTKKHFNKRSMKKR